MIQCVDYFFIQLQFLIKFELDFKHSIMTLILL